MKFDFSKNVTIVKCQDLKYYYLLEKLGLTKEVIDREFSKYEEIIIQRESYGVFSGDISIEMNPKNFAFIITDLEKLEDDSGWIIGYNTIETSKGKMLIDAINNNEDYLILPYGIGCPCSDYSLISFAIYPS